MANKKYYVKKHSNADEELISKLLIELAVYARFAQHCAWEMQYRFNGLKLLEVDCDSMQKVKDKIFNLAADMKFPLDKKYKNEIDIESREYRRSDYMLQDVFEDMRNLEEIDFILRQKAKQIYNEKPLNFDYENKIPVRSKMDCVGEGRLDGFAEMRGIRTEKKENKNDGKT